MAGVEKESVEQKLARGLTATDIELQEIEKLADNLGTHMTPGLAEALARAEITEANRDELVRVPEPIFVRDILPAISGKLGMIDMRWWIPRFGSAQRGFIIVDVAGNEIVEFPSLAPSPNLDNSRTEKPVGDSMTNFRNRVRHQGQQAADDLKQDLRRNMATGGILGYIYNQSFVERICRRYGETILSGVKPEYVKVINEGVEGLDEALGSLGTYGVSAPTTPVAAIGHEGNDDDDGDYETIPGTFD